MRVFKCLLVLCAFACGVVHADETPRKAVSQAIFKGDLEKVRALMESGAVGVDNAPLGWTDLMPWNKLLP